MNTTTNNNNNNEKTKKKDRKKITDPSLYQGYKFTQYQEKIKATEPVTTLIREEFTGNSSSNSNATIDNLKKEYDKTLNEYNDTLIKYNELTKQLQVSSTDYVQRINPKNQYLNKVIRFPSGQLYYVTNQGVAKYIPDPTILKSISGKNGCPNTSSDYINITIPWLNEYSIEGTQIPTNPPLIIGKNMKANESCGHEGSNVFVNTMLSSKPTPTYVGCYQDDEKKPSMTFIGKKYTFEGSIINGNFSQPGIGNNSFQYITSTSKIPGWNFNSACLLNNSSAWVYPIPYPNGNQCVSLQQTASISQTLNLKPGNYTLTFYSVGRNCCDNSRQSNPVNIQLNGKTFYSVQPPINQWTKYSTTFNVTTNGNNEIKFLGTWTAGDRSSAFQNISISGSDSSDSRDLYSYTACEDAAILGGYQYFALQNANSSTGLGYCAVSNDIKTVQANGTGYVFVPLWSSNTAGKPTTYATLTKNGTLTVCDANGNAYFTSPNGTACITNTEYNYSPPLFNLDIRGHDLGYYPNQTVSSCQRICDLKPECGGVVMGTPINSNMPCWPKSGDMKSISLFGSRVMYKKTNLKYIPSVNCNYFLILQNDGNMCIYRGEPNTKNTVLIWSPNTSGRQQETNTNYSLAKSKYGMSFIKNNQVLNKGDWIVSADGKLLLMMQNDGNLVLYTFKSNCAKGTGDNSKNIYGGNLANALYDIGKVGIRSNMGHLAYVDADSQIHTYPSSNITYANTYSSVIQNTNIQGNDIPGAAMSNISDITKCMNACNKYNDCNAFVYDTTGPYPVCLPKKIPENDIFSPNKLISNIGTTTYLRDKKVTNPPIGIDNTINNIDSLTYQNYGNQGGIIQEKYGLAKIISDNKQRLSQLQNKLNLLSSQLNNNVKDIQTNIVKPTEGFEGIQKFKNDILKSVQTNHKISELKKNNSEIDNILKDTNIKTLQQNYNYMLWSILALGVVIVSIKIKDT